MSIANQVTVIVLNFNKKEMLLTCLASIFQSDFSSYEVLVVDNGSSDGSAEAVEQLYPQAHLIRSKENLGPALGRNLGIRYLLGNLHSRYVLFLDNDTILSPNFISEIVKAMDKDSSVGIACGKAYMDFSRQKIMSAGMHVNLYTGQIYDIGSGKRDKNQFESLRYVPACSSFGLMAKRNVVELINGFDEVFKFYGWEDVDFCLRARQKGFQILYVPTATIIHLGGKIGRGTLANYEMGKVSNYFLILMRYNNIFHWITCASIVPIRALWIFLKILLRGNFKILAAQCQGIRNILFPDGEKI